MIKLSNCEVKEASRVYGDFAEKVAFELNIEPAAVLGSLAGGYAANSVYNKQKDKHIQNQQASRTIENNSYAQMESLLRDLKIVFTPINIVFSVNGQVFDILKTNEMTPHMKAAFLQKDAEYFKNVLMKKINMEIQLAEQVFAQRLLAAKGYGEQTKEASHIARQDCLVKMAEEQFDGMHKTASEALANATALKMDLSFDSLRPFEKSETFFRPGDMDKVAGIFDIFDRGIGDDVDIHRINREVNVGFLPDRVVFTWNNQLIEQMSLLQMNEEGYEAFRKRDKEFFLDLFKDHTVEVSNSLEKEMEQQASDESMSNPEKWWQFYLDKKENGETDEVVFEEAVEHFDLDAGEEMDLRNFYKEKGLQISDHFTVNKEAASVEDVVEELVEEEFPVQTPDVLRPFEDVDIHPLAYDRILRKYGKKWARHETEALLKQVEVDFRLENGIAEVPMNKIMILQTISSPEHSMYLTPLTFEKFVRAVNSKSVLFEEFQGNLSFEEIMFALDIAKAYDGDEVFLEFDDKVAAYISEELMEGNVRFVSDQLYDETNPSEKAFYESINGYLMRKWKNRDSQGLTDDDAIDERHILAVQIKEIADEILHEYAELLDVENPYASVETIIMQEDMLSPIAPGNKNGVRNMVKETVVAHLFAAIFLEYKRQELEATLEKLTEGGLING